jgi:hypothetical protein
VAVDVCTIHLATLISPTVMTASVIHIRATRTAKVTALSIASSDAEKRACAPIGDSPRQRERRSVGGQVSVCVV